MTHHHSTSLAQGTAALRMARGRLGRQLLLAAAAASLSLGAQACGRWDFGCHIKKVVSDISTNVTQSVNAAAANAASTVVYTVADARKTLEAFGYSASALGESGLQQAVGLLNTLSGLKKTAAKDAASASAALNTKLARQNYCKDYRLFDPLACPPGWQRQFNQEIAKLETAAMQSAKALAAAEQSLALQVAAVAQQEFDQASATVQASERTALRRATRVVFVLEDAQATAKNFVRKGFQDYLAKFQDAAIKELAKQAMNDHTVFLQGLAKAQSLDAEGQAALNRIQRALPIAFANNGAVTPQTRQDMLQLAVKLGLVSADGVTPPKLTAPSSHSSITIFVAGNAAWVGGLAVSTGFSMNLYPEADGSYLVAAVESVGGSVGWQIGANAQAGIAWSPDTVKNSVGPSLGVGIEAGVPSVSGAVTVAWDPTKLTSSWDIRTMRWNGSPLPTMSLAIGAGPSVTPVSAAVQGGYTFLATSAKVK